MGRAPAPPPLSRAHCHRRHHHHRSRLKARRGRQTARRPERQQAHQQARPATHTAQHSVSAPDESLAVHELSSRHRHAGARPHRQAVPARLTQSGAGQHRCSSRWSGLSHWWECPLRRCRLGVLVLARGAGGVRVRRPAPPWSPPWALPRRPWRRKLGFFAAGLGADKGGKDGAKFVQFSLPNITLRVL